MRYGSRWYPCRIADLADRVEPDWSKVPEDRREQVRRRWLARPVVWERWMLWGPQIPQYMARTDMRVEVE